MKTVTTTRLPSLSERLNEKFDSVTFRAHGPFSVRADDLVLDLSPVLDFRDPHHRILSMSGGYQSTRRPAFVRVILSVQGAFHPDCFETDVWVIEDLGLIELGGKIEIDLAPDALFHLVFAEPHETTCKVPVNEAHIHITLPDSEHGWSCSNPGVTIAADPDLPRIALLHAIAPTISVKHYPPSPLCRMSGEIPARMVGGGAARDDLKISLPLSDCPLGLVRVKVHPMEDHLLKPEVLLRSTLWPVFFVKNDPKQLDVTIPERFAVPENNIAAVRWEAIAVKQGDLSPADVPRIREILKEELVVSKHFPAICRKELEAFLQSHNDQKGL